MAFLRYEDVLLQVNGESMLATSASVGVGADTVPVRLIDGSLHRYAPQGGIRGQLSFQHYLTGALPSFLNVTGVTEDTVAGSLGGITFSNAYLTSSSFSVSPYSPVLVNSTFDIYGPLGGSITSNYDAELKRSEYSHGIRSFVNGLGGQINTTLSFNYSVKADRTPVYLIGDTLPDRVAKQEVEIHMALRGNSIGSQLETAGNEANLVCNIFDINGTAPLQKFNCSGQITNQTLEVSAQGYLNGNISVTQAFR
ncbi:hypothetical protein CMI37_17310 [Candidatus Pacearchaeota archaeon]|nr:hypothetical protein [Candidatus Pacearchaeota archaeon]|tara:strand:- start:727 stop:1485 length:759 start_codon:yes stop_codon:yes gene_type:complete